MPELAANDRQRAKDLSKSFHWGNLLLNTIQIALSVANWQCHYPASRYYHFCYKDDDFWNSKDNGIGGLLVVGQLIVIVLYLRECWKSASRSYLKNDMEIPEYETFISGLKASPPQVGTKIECYHYSKDRDGDEEVGVSYTGTSYWNYKSWNDATWEIVGMNEGKIIKLEVMKSYTFGNEASKEEFETHRKDYIAENKHRDKFIDSSLVYEIGGFESHVLVQNKGAKRPDCMSDYWFWFWSLLMLSWPYRMWFECMTANKRIEVKKVVYGYKGQETIL